MTKVKRVTVALLAVALILFIVAFMWRSQPNHSSQANAPVPANNDFSQAQHLKGKWVRPDGGYMLVIEEVAPDGRLKASYYNPRRINVHQANWKMSENGLQMFVELRDINYPGSKYNLVYTNQHDALTGEYFQAVQKLTFAVQFTRVIENAMK